jgi:hypothetical protein
MTTRIGGYRKGDEAQTLARCGVKNHDTPWFERACARWLRLMNRLEKRALSARRGAMAIGTLLAQAAFVSEEAE